MKIAFLLTSSGISGGHNVIFEYAFSLARKGHSVDILGTSLDQFVYAYRWHDRASFLSFKVISDCEYYDIAIATNYASVFHLPRVSSDVYTFLLQGRESPFLISGPFKDWINSVEKFGLPTLVVANWMQKYFLEKDGVDCFVCRSGIRKDLFSRSGDRICDYLKSGLRVLVEGPIGVPTKNVLKSLDICLSSRAREVWLLTSSLEVQNISTGVRVFSSIPMKDLASIYRSCDVLVKLSTSEGMFSPPLEMFHCGGTVVSYDVPGCEEYLVHGQNSFVIPIGREDLVLEAINSLCDNSALLEGLKAGAIETADKWPDWDTAVEKFEDGLVWVSENFSMSRDDLFRIIQGSTKKYLSVKWRERKNHLNQML